MHLERKINKMNDVIDRISSKIVTIMSIREEIRLLKKEEKA